MTIAEYQEQAITTHQAPAKQAPDPVIPLLGLAGEAGELLSEYKKWLAGRIRPHTRELAD